MRAVFSERPKKPIDDMTFGPWRAISEPVDDVCTFLLERQRVGKGVLAVAFSRENTQESSRWFAHQKESDFADVGRVSICSNINPANFHTHTHARTMGDG